jgi:lymphocyte antigen 6 complex protein
MDVGNGNYILLCIIVVFTTASALECYSCTNQDSNREKCIKTSKQCEQDKDACVSYIRWGIAPYWTPRGNRIHFISKDCDTQQNCAARQKSLQESCVRDWYLDWACLECCTGDLCNYYVTLGSSRPNFCVWTTIVCTVLTLLAVRFHL